MPVTRSCAETRMMTDMRVLNGRQGARSLLDTRRAQADDAEVRERVQEIVAAVREGGDRAVRQLTERFDKVALDEVKVPQAAFEEAEQQVPGALKEAIRLAAGRIRSFHQQQPAGGFLHPSDGALLGQLVRPLERVACYVPGGSAPLFSSLLMTAVPAHVAGVPEIVVATPPRPDGSVAPEMLVAAREAGVQAVYRMGGAQAIAALAYGTEQIPKVDKIVGPGNLYVVIAKQLVYGAVGIESLPGPTETLIIADEQADIHHVVADLLAQAEHQGAQPVLVTTSQLVIDEVREVLEQQLSDLPTGPTARESLSERGYAVLVDDIAEAIEVANAYAPEHLCLLMSDPWSALTKVKHAGGIFVGAHSMEALGDYLAGPSHVMPTGGTARFSSALNVRDFQKVIPLVSTTPALLDGVGPAAARMARAEGLEAHARAIESRLNKKRA